ncbi:MAG: hypothetical protein JOZ17_13505 [Acetobacteraceae bacterium]|nr:hypothetical protein [Acetobacteraceae bacterium]
MEELIQGFLHQILHRPVCLHREYANLTESFRAYIEGDCPLSNAGALPTCPCRFAS